MIRVFDSRSAAINTPLDAKSCNWYLDETTSLIKVETIAEYLLRHNEEGYRVPGAPVTILLPKEGSTPTGSYEIEDFSSAITADYDIKYYGFVGGLADENFVEIDMGGGLTDVFVQDHGYIPRLLDLKYTKGGTDYHITTIKKLDGIIYGGKLIYLGGLSFFLNNTITAFFGNIYTASGIITHDAADATYDRIDVITTTSENTVTIVKGTPSANPVKPVLAPGTHKEVTTILIKAGSTTPDGITGTVVYNENIEWTVSASGLTIDADSTTDPFIGDVCIDASDAGNGDEIIFTSGANENVADYSEITLQTKLKTTFTTKQYGIYVAFYQDTELVSNIVTLPIEAQNTGWQNFVLNFSEFSFTGTTFNKIVVGFINSSGTDFPGFYLDYIVLQKGIIQPPVVDSHPPVTIAENSKQYLKIGPDQKLEIVVDELPGGTGADVIAGDGMDFANNDPVTLGLPSTIDSTTENAVTETSHTHKLGNIPASAITNQVAPEYGYLYNWWVTQEDVAPTGWHVPTKAELETLLNEIDTYDSELPGWPLAGGKLKETGFSHWDSPNTGATNDYEFNVIGSGYRNDYDGVFYGLKQSGEFWSSSESLLVSTNGIIFSFGYDYEYVQSGENGTDKKGGYSLRFIKDDSTDPGTVTDYDGNVYPTVKIGDQVWMAQNFMGTHYNDGSPIAGPNFTDEQWAALTTPAYCVYKQTLEEKLADIDHNSTKNKQGGDEENNEFYHLTADELAKVQALDNSIEIYIDFLDTTPFVFTAPYAMKFTAQTSEGADATISPVLNTDLAQYDDVTVTPAEVGLIILTGTLL